MVLIARILLFAGTVVIAAALGAILIFFGTFYISTMLGADNMNGGLAMGAAGLMPIGALIGAVIGAWFAWRMIRRFEAKAVMGAGFGLAGLAMLAVGGWFAYQELTDGDPYDVVEEPMVQIEWRLPERLTEEQIKPVYRYTMRSTFMDWTLSSSWDIPPHREEGGKTILRFRGYIRWRADGRIFQLWKFPKHDDRITVDLDLGGDPPHAEDYGSWREVKDAPGHAFRTRVVRK